MSVAEHVLRIVIAAAVILISSGSMTRAQTDNQIRFVRASTVGAGYAQCMDIFGDFLVVGAAGFVSVVEVSSGQAPTEVGRFEVEHNLHVYHVTVEGKLAFIVIEDGQALIIDLDDPTHPKQVGRFEPVSEASGTREIEVVGFSAYLVDSAGALRVFDVSDPTRPVLQGEAQITPLKGRVWDLDVFDRHVYISTGDELIVVDVSNPKTPQQVASLPRDGSVRWVGLYIENGIGYAGAQVGGLIVLDLSNPGQPIELARMRLPIVESHAGRVGEPTKIGDLLIVPSTERGLTIIDVTDAHRPETVTTVALPGSNTRTALADSEQVFVLDPDIGLHVVDASNLARLRLSASLEWPSSLVSLQTENSHAFALHRVGRLLVYDVSDEYWPQEIARLETPAGWIPLAMALRGNYAYVVMTNPTQIQGMLQVIDIHEPSRPTLSSGTGISFGFVGAAEFCGNGLYLSGKDGIAHYDLTQPGQPRFSTSWTDETPTVRSLACDSKGLYVVASRDGEHLFSFDLNSPDGFTPSSILPLDKLNPPRSLAVTDRFLVAGSNEGVAFYDIQLPGMPVRKVLEFESQFRGRFIEAMELQGTTLYLLGENIIAAADFSDADASPVERGYSFELLSASLLSVDGPTMVVGDRISGLTLIEIVGNEIPTPVPSPTSTATAPPLPFPEVYIPLLVQKW